MMSEYLCVDDGVVCVCVMFKVSGMWQEMKMQGHHVTGTHRAKGKCRCITLHHCDQNAPMGAVGRSKGFGGLQIQGGFCPSLAGRHRGVHGGGSKYSGFLT